MRPVPHMPPLCWLAQLVGELAQRLELVFDAATIAELPEEVESVVVAREYPLLVADLFTQRDQLRSFGDAVGDVLRSFDRDPAPVEGKGKGGWVTHPPRNLHGLLSQTDPAIARAIVTNRTGETGEQSGARGAVVLPHRRQRALQHGEPGRDPCWREPRRTFRHIRAPPLRAGRTGLPARRAWPLGGEASFASLRALPARLRTSPVRAAARRACLRHPIPFSRARRARARNGERPPRTRVLRRGPAPARCAYSIAFPATAVPPSGSDAQARPGAAPGFPHRAPRAPPQSPDAGAAVAVLADPRRAHP